MTKYQISNIKIDFKILETTKQREAIINKLGLVEQLVKEFKIIKKSLDARKRNSAGIFYVYTVSFSYSEKIRLSQDVKIIDKNSENEQVISDSEMLKNKNIKPVIVGAGPAGLFAALYLAKMGYKPLIFDRGKDIEERTSDVNNFSATGEINPESNISFGLGGAGTFSDAKLNSRVKSPLRKAVLEEFISVGAPKSIIYDAKPHLGTDKIRVIMSDLKAKIEYYGGEFHFSSKLTDIKISNNKVESIIINNEDEYQTDALIIAIGNAAKDTFKMIHELKIDMSNKPFAVGFRVEHKREEIDRAVYGQYAGSKILGAGSYNLTYNDKETGRGIYSFCNCPGGVVVAAANDYNQVATNGMSFYNRSMENTNSAIVVNVTSKDFGDEVLGGVKFQEEIERKAFELGGGDYKAPCQSVYEFMGIEDKKTNVVPTYKPGVKYTDLNDLLPKELNTAIQNGLKKFSAIFPCFAHGILTGVESRTSSPVRIIRDNKTLESTNTKGIYPAGEGSGYAGGILSSAVDGIKIALAINNNK